MADMTQPSLSVLSKQSVHTGKTNTRQDISVGYFVQPGYAQDTANASQVECVEPTLLADSEEALQDSIDSFADAASSFGLTINCKKTEVLALQNSVVRNPLSVNGTHLASVHSFKYLGSTVTDDCRLDKELDCRIQCATTSFGRLWNRLWSSHEISNKTKISVYTAAITSALLFGAETWTLYQRHFVRLRRVQQRNLRAILRVPYTDRITNDQILD